LRAASRVLALKKTPCSVRSRLNDDVYSFELDFE